MIVTVILHTNHQSQTQSGWQRQFDVTLLSGSTVAELIPDLGMELPMETTLMVVNGHTARPDTVLQEGDRITLMPAIWKDKS
jgi:sulfur carrier protein ThiS